MEVLSECVDKLGQWCIEIFTQNDEFLPTPEHRQQYFNIYEKTLIKSIDLLNTDKPKVGRH